jgi:hypothetical protein
MALEATFQDLSVCLHRLHDSLNELQVTVGDKPPVHESAMADGLETVVLDMMGILEDARTAARNARKAVGPPVNLDHAQRTLTICQDRFDRIEQQFASDLASHERIEELERLGNERRAWLAWSSTVKQRIEQCRVPLAQTSAALAACSRELAAKVS